MDPYISSVMEGKKMLILEREVDEDLQADLELKTEYETVADRFIDSDITDEDLEGAIEEEEINITLDDLIDEVNEDELLLSEPDTFPDDDGELSEINAILDSDIDPDIFELDDNEDLYAE